MLQVQARVWRIWKKMLPGERVTLPVTLPLARNFIL
jgi:hypothetical protein